MPHYDYRCDACNYQFEVEQRMSDEPLKQCPRCGQMIHRVFSASPVIFRGDGFYSTDTRKKGTTESSS
jgi:putative FmdB family regulatory protein